MPKFETDGVRGDESVVNPVIAYRLGLGIASLGAEEVITGGDTRRSTKAILDGLHAGLHDSYARGIPMGVVPTPAVAYVSDKLGKYAAVVTASHNPYTDNGVKVFAPGGKKIDDETAMQLEHRINGDAEPFDGEYPKPNYAPQLIQAYQAHLIASAEDDDLLQETVVAFDGANGAAFKIGPAVFSELGAHVYTMACEPDGVNINENCGAASDLAGIVELTQKTGAAMGVTVDGDVDRVKLVTPTGRILDGDRIMLILAAQAKAEGKDIQTLVGTLMSNIGFQEAVAKRGIHLLRADVGDRYVSEMMDQEGATIGGEQSGHIILKEYAHSGDGLLTAIQVLKAVKASRRSLDEWYDDMIDYPQVLRNIKGVPKELARHPDVVAVTQELQANLGETGTINVRPSGTEPLVRVMIQSSTLSLPEVKSRVDAMERLIRGLA